MKRFFIFPLLLLLNACQPHTTQHNPPSTIRQTQPLNIVTPDWAIASTLTAMGYPPIATGDIRTYQDWVAEPKLPETTIDLGVRFAPNPERLAQLHPDLIIDNDFYAHLRPQYGDTPHVAVAFAPKNAMASWQDYAEPTLKLGEIIQQPQAAEQFLSQSKQRLNELGKTFERSHPALKKIAVVQFSDSNNLHIYTNNSLFKPTFDAMGLTLVTLENQLGQGNAWGFLPITLGDLAKLDDATCLVVIEPFSPMLQQELASNLLWQRLGYRQTKCMTVLPPLWTYGGVSSMVTFGERLNQAQFAPSKLSTIIPEENTNGK